MPPKKKTTTSPSATKAARKAPAPKRTGGGRGATGATAATAAVCARGSGGRRGREGKGNMTDAQKEILRKVLSGELRMEFEEEDEEDEDLYYDPATDDEAPKIHKIDISVSNMPPPITDEEAAAYVPPIENYNLFQAILRRDIKGVMVLLKRGGIDLNTLRSAKGSLSALHIAAQKANYKGSLKMLKALIDAGCDVNSVDEKGETPLHKATDRSNLAAVKYLIEVGKAVEKAKTSPAVWVPNENDNATSATTTSGSSGGHYLQPLWVRRKMVEDMLVAAGLDKYSFLRDDPSSDEEPMDPRIKHDEYFGCYYPRHFV